MRQGFFRSHPAFWSSFMKRIHWLVNLLIQTGGGLPLTVGNKARNQISTSISTQKTCDLRTLGCSFINGLSLAGNTLTWRVIRKQIYCLQMGGRDENPRMFREKILFCSESCPGAGRVSLPWIPAGRPLREPWKEASSVVHISGQHDSLSNILRDMMFSENGETITGCSGKVLGSHYSDQQFSVWLLPHFAEA